MHVRNDNLNLPQAKQRLHIQFDLKPQNIIIGQRNFGIIGPPNNRRKNPPGPPLGSCDHQQNRVFKVIYLIM